MGCWRPPLHQEGGLFGFFFDRYGPEKNMIFSAPESNFENFPSSLCDMCNFVEVDIYHVSFFTSRSWKFLIFHLLFVFEIQVSGNVSPSPHLLCSGGSQFGGTFLGVLFWGGFYNMHPTTLLPQFALWHHSASVPHPGRFPNKLKHQRWGMLGVKS